MSRSFESTGLSLNNLSEKVDDHFEQLQTSLKYQLAKLTTKLDDSNIENVSHLCYKCLSITVMSDLSSSVAPLTLLLLLHPQSLSTDTSASLRL